METIWETLIKTHLYEKIPPAAILLLFMIKLRAEPLLVEVEGLSWVEHESNPANSNRVWLERFLHLEEVVDVSASNASLPQRSLFQLRGFEILGSMLGQ